MLVIQTGDGNGVAHRGGNFLSGCAVLYGQQQPVKIREIEQCRFRG